jgi:hypothetical protein
MTVPVTKAFAGEAPVGRDDANEAGDKGKRWQHRNLSRFTRRRSEYPALRSLDSALIP